MDTTNITQILVPIDFSTTSLNAMDTAVAIAKRQGARLTLLFVLDDVLLSYHRYEALPIIPVDPVIQTTEKESGEILRQISAGLVAEHGIDVRWEIVQGFVSSQICQYSEQKAIQLIIMGTHGTSGFREFFMGTTAYSVIKQAPCPVLTVPPNKKWLDFSNILFPVRNISGNLDKYAFLRKIIRNNNSTLHIVGLPDNQGDLAKKRIANSILQLKSKLRFDGVEHLTQRLEPNSRVAETVLNIAQKLHADLIAITATLDYSLRDYFIGPYTQQIVHHAQVPILSIRPHTPLKSKADTLLSISPEYQAVASNLSF